MQAARYLETCPTLLDCLAIADRERGPPIGPAPFLVFLGLKIELDANLILCVLDAMATPAVRLDLVAIYRLASQSC